MIKKTNSMQTKEYLRSRDRDRLYKFVLDEGRVRGAYVQGNLVVSEMARNHHLGPLETFLLGQGYLAALLMSSNLKGDDRINLKVSTDGPAQGMSVDSNAHGEVRGYLFQNPIRVPADWEDPTIAQTMGKGLLSVTRYIENRRVPVTGSVEYQTASLASSLAHYFDQSEQIPTALDLSLPFNREGELLGAGGLILQALPGFDPENWETLMKRLYEIPSIGESAAESHDLSALLQFWFGEFQPKVLESHRVEFFCPCSKDRFQLFIKGLPKKDQDEILADGPFPLETTCHNCSSVYAFTREELVELWKS